MAGKTYTCKVFVSEIISNKPLAGIKVVFYSEDEKVESMTNSEGTVVFSGLRSKVGTLLFVDPSNIYVSKSINVHNSKRMDQEFSQVLNQPLQRKPLSFYTDRNKLYPISNPQDSLDLADTINCDHTLDTFAEFPGGTKAMKQFISAYIQYPTDALELGEHGRVYVSFIVEKDGTITHAEVKKSLFRSLDSEAISLIYSMPTWSPGMHCGKPIRNRVRLPITFVLE